KDMPCGAGRRTSDSCHTPAQLPSDHGSENSLRCSDPNSRIQLHRSESWFSLIRYRFFSRDTCCARSESLQLPKLAEWGSLSGELADELHPGMFQVGIQRSFRPSVRLRQLALLQASAE